MALGGAATKNLGAAHNVRCTESGFGGLLLLAGALAGSGGAPGYELDRVGRLCARISNPCLSNTGSLENSIKSYSYLQIFEFPSSNMFPGSHRGHEIKRKCPFLNYSGS